MNTAHRTRRIGSATALLLGSALALVPITAHANETDASIDGVVVRFIPSDNDPRGRHLVRQVETVDPDVPVRPAQNLRQLIEADRGSAATVAPAPRFIPSDNDPRGHHQVPAPAAPIETPEPADGTRSTDDAEPTTRSFPSDNDPRGLHGLSRWEQLLYQPRHNAQR